MQITIQGVNLALSYTIGRLRKAGVSGLQEVGDLLSRSPTSFEAVQKLVDIGTGESTSIDEWTLQDMKRFVEGLAAELGQDPTTADGSTSGPSAGMTSA